MRSPFQFKHAMIDQRVQRRLCSIVALGMLVVGLTPAWISAQETPPPETAAAGDQISALIEQLSADRFSERQAAMRKLVEFGQRVIEPVENSIQSGEPEMRMRSMAVLQRLAISRDPQTQRAAQEAIQRLAESENRHGELRTVSSMDARIASADSSSLLNRRAS